MKSTCAVLPLLSLILLFSCESTESRKDPAGEYWSIVMKEQPMPKAIQSLIIPGHDYDHSTPKIPNQKTKCSNHDKSTTILNTFTQDFEPEPHATSYPDDNDVKSLVKTSFTKDFEPEPHVTAYPNNDVKSSVKTLFTKDFEPEPHVTAYPNNEVKSSSGEYSMFTKDFEPEPHASVYPDNEVKSSSGKYSMFTKDFEPEPHVTAYPNDIQTK
ncbi:hypothetical protein CsatB_013043 [Cannabis sativa]